MAAVDPAFTHVPLTADACVVTKISDNVFAPPVQPTTHVVLQSNDAPTPFFFAIPRAAATQASELLLHLLESEDGSSGEVTVIPTEADAWTLSRVCAYMLHHTDNAAAEIEKPMTRQIAGYVSEWDRRLLYEELLEDGDEQRHDGLIVAMQAAHNLNIRGLLELCGAAIAHIMRGKDVETIRGIFKVEQDQSDEELERIRKSNAVFDKTMGLAPAAK